MIITNMNQLDLTGKDTEYTRPARKFKVFSAKQKIALNEPVYANSIVVTKVTASGSEETLIKGSGWNTDNSHIDYEATSRAKIKFDSLDSDELLSLIAVSGSEAMMVSTMDTTVNNTKRYYKAVGTSYQLIENPSDNPAEQNWYEPKWNATIVNSFMMSDILIPSPEYTIKVSYQSLEKDIKHVYRDGLGPEYSPGLMRSVVEAVDELYAFHRPVESLMADSLFQFHSLEEDLTGKSSENKIEDEVHNVDVSANKFVVRPHCGSFYPWPSDSDYALVIEYMPIGGSVKRVLTEHTDYEIVGVNYAKTSVCEPPCGVYEFIVLKNNLKGTIYITYQAFGGDVTQKDIYELSRMVENLYLYYQNTEFVTRDNINQTTVVKGIIDRLDYLDETIRHYRSQRFQYTTNADGSDKWVNVAFIEKNPWSDRADVPDTALGEFRFEVPGASFLAELRISYDTKTNIPANSHIAPNMLNITVCHCEISNFDDLGYIYFNRRVLPKFRIILIGTSDEDRNKGIMLQMSMSATTATEYTVIVTDRTGTKSPWFLIDTQSSARPVHESNTYAKFLNNVEWYTAQHLRSNEVPVFPKGYTIFIGAYPITEIEFYSVNKSDAETAPEATYTNTIDKNGVEITQPLIPINSLNLADVNYVEFYVYDRYTEQHLISRSQKVKLENNSFTADAMYFTDDLCVISLKLEQYTLDNDTKYHYKGTLTSRTGTNSLINDRFVLTRIDILQ